MPVSTASSKRTRLLNSSPPAVKQHPLHGHQHHLHASPLLSPHSQHPHSHTHQPSHPHQHRLQSTPPHSLVNARFTSPPTIFGSAALRYDPPTAATSLSSSSSSTTGQPASSPASSSTTFHTSTAAAAAAAGAAASSAANPAGGVCPLDLSSSTPTGAKRLKLSSPTPSGHSLGSPPTTAASANAMAMSPAAVAPMAASDRRTPTVVRCQAQTEEINAWTVAQVCEFVGSIDICAEYTEVS